MTRLPTERYFIMKILKVAATLTYSNLRLHLRKFHRRFNVRLNCLSYSCYEIDNSNRRRINSDLNPRFVFPTGGGSPSARRRRWQPPPGSPLEASTTLGATWGSALGQTWAPVRVSGERGQRREYETNFEYLGTCKGWRGEGAAKGI